MKLVDYTVDFTFYGVEKDKLQALESMLEKLRCDLQSSCRCDVHMGIGSYDDEYEGGK